MARLPALINSFLSTDGRDRSTIEHTARVIREHGLIPTIKRGAGAAVMTSREAVNLLFALNGASTPKDGVAAVERLRLLQRAGSGHSACSVFEALRDIAGFGEALEYLIDNYPSVPSFFGQSFERIDEFFFDRFEIGIEIHQARATIFVKGRGNSDFCFRAFYRLSGKDADRYLEKNFDRRVVSHLSERTIHELWHCVSGGFITERD